MLRVIGILIIQYDRDSHHLALIRWQSPTTSSPSKTLRRRQKRRQDSINGGTSYFGTLSGPRFQGRGQVLRAAIAENSCHGRRTISLIRCVPFCSSHLRDGNWARGIVMIGLGPSGTPSDSLFWMVHSETLLQGFSHHSLVIRRIARPDLPLPHVARSPPPRQQKQFNCKTQAHIIPRPIKHNSKVPMTPRHQSTRRINWTSQRQMRRLFTTYHPSTPLPQPPHWM